jgi:S1-C subfamily serine protease
MTPRHLALAALLALMAGTAMPAEPARDPFAEAGRYTVRLSVSSQHSFIEQDAGSWEGAGFLVDRSRGWILTNAHVSGYAPTRIRAAFRDGEPIDARAVFIDNLLDLALLQVPPDSLPPDAIEARLACDGLPAVGTILGTFGHPMGYAFTATRGILAGVSGAHGYPMIQTDAPISPGNSGGPLINLDSGEIIGVNTSSAADRRAQNMNFAVMSRHACRVLELLRTGRPATVPRISTPFARDADGTPTLPVALDPAVPDGWGLRAGDRVLGVEGMAGEPGSAAELLLALRGATGRVPLRVERGGRRIIVPATLTPSLQYVGRRGLSIDGVVFGPRELFQVATPDEAGTLIIHHVEFGSTGALQDIDYGGEVVSVDGEAIRSLSQLEAVAQRAAAAGRPLTLILRVFDDEEVNPAFYLVRQLPAESVQRYPD